MTRLFFVCFFVSFSLASMAQGYMHKSRKNVQKEIQKYLKKNNLQATVIESDSTLEFSISEDKINPARFTWQFDDQDKCIKEQTFACDSCAHKYFRQWMDQPFKWQQVNSTTWISSFFWHLLMELKNENGHAILTVLTIDWSRKQYDAFIKAAGR